MTGDKNASCSVAMLGCCEGEDENNWLWFCVAFFDWQHHHHSSSSGAERSCSDLTGFSIVVSFLLHSSLSIQTSLCCWMLSLFNVRFNPGLWMSCCNLDIQVVLPPTFSLCFFECFPSSPLHFGIYSIEFFNKRYNLLMLLMLLVYIYYIDAHYNNHTFSIPLYNKDWVRVLQVNHTCALFIKTRKKLSSRLEPNQPRNITPEKLHWSAGFSLFNYG